MQLNVWLEGGTYNGRLAKISIGTTKFRIGMKLSIEGEVYTVLDGPAARAHEKAQKYIDNLCIRCVHDSL